MLIGLPAPGSLGQPCQIAMQIRFEFVYVAAKDVLFIAGSACIVVVCVKFVYEFGLLVDPLDLLDRPSATTSRWKQTSELQVSDCVVTRSGATCRRLVL